MSLRGVQMRKGARAIFTKVIPGDYNAVTEETGASTTLTIPGYALRIQGDPDEYTKLGLIQSEHPMLSFSPDVPGQLPVAGWEVEFGGEVLTVEDVNPCAMNGTATSAHVRCSR
jgi:hypothetical protein